MKLKLLGLFLMLFVLPVLALASTAHVAPIVLVAAAGATFSVQAKILAIVAVVYSLIQALKKAFPSLGGWYAIALNLVLSVLGVLVTVQPQDLFSWATLSAVVTAVLGAAGIHGTVSKLSS